MGHNPFMITYAFPLLISQNHDILKISVELRKLKFCIPKPNIPSLHYNISVSSMFSIKPIEV